MLDAPALTVLATAGPRSRPLGQWSFDGVDVVEIVAPDRHSAAMLLEFAGPSFPAELGSGSPWIVTFRRPSTGGDWVVGALALVERRLESVPLPCAKVISHDRAYLVRAPTARLEI